MKKITSVFTVLFLTLSVFSFKIFAQSDSAEERNHCIISDPFEYIDSVYLDEINSRFESFYEETGIETQILIFDYIGEEKTEENAVAQAANFSQAFYSSDDDSITLFLNNDNGIDVVYGTGKGLFYSKSEDFLSTLESYWAYNRTDNNFGACIVDFAIVADSYSADAESWWQSVNPAEESSASDNEIQVPEENISEGEKEDLTEGILISSNKKAYIVDESRYFTAKERERLLEQAEDYTLHTGLNIVIAVSDDVGSDKSDSGVVDYADLMYEKYCGINTDGILFLINNDTKYDYISTSGSGINYYSDWRIERLLDKAYDYLTEDDYYSAASAFISLAKNYYDAGKENHQTEILGREFESESFIASFIVVGIIALVIGIVIYFSLANSYKLQKPNNALYVVQGSKIFQQATDTFAGTITTRTYSPRSSGGSGGGGHSGHSSTHRSSSGGRHGGGGRHR